MTGRSTIPNLDAKIAQQKTASQDRRLPVALRQQAHEAANLLNAVKAARGT